MAIGMKVFGKFLETSFAAISRCRFRTRESSIRRKLQNMSLELEVSITTLRDLDSRTRQESLMIQENKNRMRKTAQRVHR